MASESRTTCDGENKLKNIDVTPDELDRFSKALKDENFRKLLGEYAEEIRDPENRKRYEAEIAALEEERGYDITWIHPQPGFVLKLSSTAGDKVFINIASNGSVGAPSCAPSQDGGRRGLNWSIPYAQARPRQDHDKAGSSCVVYDVVFHPDTLHMAGRSPQMRRLVEQTALDAVEKAFQAGLKRDKVAYPKLKYKGVPQAAMVRRKKGDGVTGGGAACDDVTPLPEAVVEELRREAAGLTLNDKSTIPAKPATTQLPDAGDAAGYTTPEFQIVYRDQFDMQQFAMRCGSGERGRPQALVLRISLPGLSSAAGLDLDVGTHTVKLRSEAGQRLQYRLDVVLPFPVDDKAGSATFDRSAQSLVVSLPVAPPQQLDSGIDSDCARHSSSEDDAYRTREGGEGDGGSDGAAGDDAIVDLGDVDLGADLGPETDVADDGDAVMVMEKTPDRLTDKPTSPAPSPPTPPRLYSLPQYKLHQDDRFLYIQLTEPNLEPDSVSATREVVTSSVTVTASSMGAGMTRFYFRLRLAPPGGLGGPEVLSREAGVTVRVEKEEAGADWSGCHLGADERSLQEVLIPWQTEQETAADTVVAARATASTSSLGSVTSYDGPLSAISSQSSLDEPSCQKKSILKKRYVSESSADEVFSPGSAALSASALLSYDEAEEARAKKAVRFSDYVLEKRYRSTATILHDVQRTERQRAKKKRARAARRHSEGDTSENDEFRSPARDGAADAAPLPAATVRRFSSDTDTSENDEYASSATDGSNGGPGVGGKESKIAKKRKNKRKRDRSQKDQLNNELMFELDM